MKSLPSLSVPCIRPKQRGIFDSMRLSRNSRLKWIASVILALGVVSPVVARTNAVTAGQPCNPGTYSSNGTDGNGACTLASPGYYVPTFSAKSQTAAPLGSYVPTAGATAATPAPLGSYVNIIAATAPTLAAPGTYVNTVGATAATPAPPGSFVSTVGATAPTLAAPGTYVSTLGATAATSAPLGSYVSTAGATAPTLAAPGTYVSTVGATAATAAPLGSYVATAGATAPTLAAPGTYVNTIGATAATAAPLGTFVSAAGATAPTLAAPGTYVAIVGATAPTLASKGYFVPTTGATTQAAAPAGLFVNTAGAAVASACPDGSSSYGASVACRVGPNLNSVAGVTVSPQFDLSVIGPDVVVGHRSSQVIQASNSSTDLGFSDILTDLTLLSASITGGDAASFSLLGFTPGRVLHEGGLDTLLMTLVFDDTGLAPGTYTTSLFFVTDQENVFGTEGRTHGFTLSATVDAVPEPETYAMLLAGLGVMGWAVRRRNQVRV